MPPKVRPIKTPLCSPKEIKWNPLWGGFLWPQLALFPNRSRLVLSPVSTVLYAIWTNYRIVILIFSHLFLCLNDPNKGVSSNTSQLLFHCFDRWSCTARCRTAAEHICVDYRGKQWLCFSVTCSTSKCLVFLRKCHWKMSCISQSLGVHLLGAETVEPEEEDPVAAGNPGGSPCWHYAGGWHCCPGHDHRDSRVGGPQGERAC